MPLAFFMQYSPRAVATEISWQRKIKVILLAKGVIVNPEQKESWWAIYSNLYDAICHCTWAIYQVQGPYNTINENEDSVLDVSLSSHKCQKKRFTWSLLLAVWSRGVAKRVLTSACQAVNVKRRASLGLYLYYYQKCFDNISLSI